MRVFASGFFMNQFPPNPRVSHLNRFKFFNIRRDIQVKVHHHNTGGEIATGINNTGGKFANGINDTVANFATSFISVVDTGGNLQYICNTGNRDFK